jgi:hypothetical protein
LIVEDILEINNIINKFKNHKIMSLNNNFKQLIRQRETYNEKILNELCKILNENPELRFNQIMYILNETNDYFNEEPKITYERLVNKFNKQKN